MLWKPLKNDVILLVEVSDDQSHLAGHFWRTCLFVMLDRCALRGTQLKPLCAFSQAFPNHLKIVHDDLQPVCTKENKPFNSLPSEVQYT